jgi:hypothetical protein
VSCLISDFVSINIIYSTLCKSVRNHIQKLYTTCFLTSLVMQIEKPIWLVISGKQCYPFHPIPAQFIQPTKFEKTVCHPPELCQSRLRTSSWPWRSESAATCRKSPIRSQSCHFVSSNLAFSTLLSPSITLFVPGSAHSQLYLGSPAAPASRNLMG